MKLTEKLGIYTIDDERKRSTLFPVRVVLTKGNVTGSECLTVPQPLQVAPFCSQSQCTMKNQAGGENAAVLLDFGRELHGTATVSARAVSGEAKCILRFGESASEALTPLGVKNTTNDHANRDIPFSCKSWSSNESNETGFRFVYLELTSPDMAMQLRCITATLIYRDLEYRGSFHCSDPLLDRIYDVSAYTVHLNMQRYLWDGIKRDRLVWAGDMNTEIATILAVFGNNPVVPKSLDFVKSITPSEMPMNNISAYNLWWMLCHKEWYMGTGDLTYLQEQRDYLKNMLARYATYVDDSGSEILPEGRFADWPTNENPEEQHRGLQGLLRYAMNEGAELMHYLDEPEMAALCTSVANKLAKHNPGVGTDKQATALMVLGGIIDPKEAFDKCIGRGGANGLSSFLSAVTLSAVAKSGEYSAALDMIRSYWGGMLDMGATTFWEDFDLTWMENAAPITDPVPAGMKDIHGDFGNFCYKQFRHSLCHGWAAAPVPYLVQNVMGLTAVEPGMKTVRFAPHLSGLDWVQGVYPTPYGDIRVEITQTGKTIDAPKEITILE